MQLKVFPPNEHMKVSMYVNALLGMWPDIFPDNPFLRKLYNIYGFCVYSYCTLFTISAVIQLIILLSDEIIYMDEVVANICITILYTVVLLRAFQIRAGRIDTILQNIIETEHKIYRCGDEEIIEIYDNYVQQSKLTNQIYLVSVFLTTVFYFVHPIFVDDQIRYYPKRNITMIKKPLPLSSYIPYDVNEYYLYTYFWQILDGCIGASYVTYTDMFMFSLIIFPLGQIKILGHIMRNFEKYSRRVQMQLNCDMEEASFITLRESILKHKDIISYIQNFNTTMKNVMVLDFLQSSIQLASIILQLLVTEMTLNNFLFAGQFAVSMLARLLFYYWYANEISSQSADIAVSLWCSQWYAQSEDVQRMIIIILMRCSRETGLEIGPFSKMSLSTFLGILKATYSYMTVVYR